MSPATLSLGVIAAAVALFVASQYLPATDPRAALVSYVRFQAARENAAVPASATGGGENDNNVEALRLDGVDTFADLACVTAHGPVDSARSALLAQLGSVPPDVAAEMVAAAVLPKTSVETARQNASAALAADGVAYAYMYYFNTRYEAATDTYHACAVASGVRLAVAEHVAGYEEEQREQIIGHEPCFCVLNNLFCRSCPVRHVAHLRRPVMARHALTLDDHRRLRRTMILQAWDQVRGMHAPGDAITQLKHTATHNQDLVAAWDPLPTQPPAKEQ